MLPHRRQGDLHGRAEGVGSKMRYVIFRGDVLRPNVVICAQAKGYRVILLRHRGKQVVVSVEHGKTAGTQTLQNFKLCL